MSVPLPEFSLLVREPVEMELARRFIEYLSAAGLKAGDRLPSERRLSEALGVGRASLRSALKSLSLLGVIEQKPGSGTFLRNGGSDLLPRVVEWGLLLGDHGLGEVLEAREKLEVVLAGMAAQRRSEADLVKLRRIIENMATHGQDADRYVQEDIAFHLAIADSAKNELIAGILRNLQSLLQAWATRVITAAGETETSLAMHVPILDAIVASDPAAATAAMQAHMNRATARLRTAIAEAGSDKAGARRHAGRS